MTFCNNSAKGISFVGITAMIPVPGSNTAPNSQGIPNHPNYFLCGGNEQTVSTLRVSTFDAGGLVGAASGTVNAKMDPVQGSGKFFIQGSPITRLSDMSMTNNFNAPTTQIAPSQTKVQANG